MKTAIATVSKALSRAISSNSIGSHVLKEVITICAAGLFVSIVLLTHGLDLSPGFF
jgi:hypothetical protein